MDIRGRTACSLATYLLHGSALHGMGTRIIAEKAGIWNRFTGRQLSAGMKAVQTGVATVAPVPSTTAPPVMVRTYLAPAIHPVSNSSPKTDPRFRRGESK